LSEAKDVPTHAECALFTDKDSDCLPYFVAEDPPKSCSCCTGELKYLDITKSTNKSTAERNVYKIEGSKSTISKMIDIPIEI
jgi:hypothetical protein